MTNGSKSAAVLCLALLIAACGAPSKQDMTNKAVTAKTGTYHARVLDNADNLAIADIITKWNRSAFNDAMFSVAKAKV